MLHITFKSTAALLRRAEELKQRQIFNENTLLRRETDLSQDRVDSFINLAFKATMICHDSLEELKNISDESEQIFLLHDSRSKISNLRTQFDESYKELKNDPEYKDKNIHLNEYVMTTNNLILCSDLNLAEREIEICNDKS